MGRAESDGVREWRREAAWMSASNEWRREGIVCPPCSSRPGWESCSCTGASLVIKHKNSLHEIFSEINSSQAACKASQLSSVHSVWALMMNSLQHSCATSSPIVPVSHHNVTIFKENSCHVHYFLYKCVSTFRALYFKMRIFYTQKLTL